MISQIRKDKKEEKKKDIGSIWTLKKVPFKEFTNSFF